MREIEFRGKRKDNGEWIYGSLIISNDNYYITEGYCEIGTFDLNFIKYEVIPETIGQYAGLKDKNGKKIFEGDIVDVTRPCVWERGIVIFKNGCFFIKVKETLLPLYECEINNYKLEVINNIYDNPELLKEEL